MKLEIEITEVEIKSAIERKIRVAIADEVNAWSSDQYIKEQIKKCWKAVADKAIQEACSDAPALQQKIMNALEHKIRGQLTAVMKAGNK